MKQRFPSLGVSRRTVLAAIPAVLTAGLGTKPARAQAGAGDRHDAAFAALAPYCGVYRIGDGHALGIERFINDAGEGVLLFADYGTSLVRSLFVGADDKFVMGPTFDSSAPVALTVRFERGPDGAVSGLRLSRPDGTEIRAARTEARAEEVAFAQGDAKLAGTVIVPEGPGPHPAIVLLHGSGPLTRYSFGPYARFFNSLGLAVLVYDKRGTGLSTGRRLDASTGAPETLWPAYYPDDIAADALAAFELLKGRPEIDPARIGFWGSSEGGMLSTQVAARSRDVAFAINSSGFMGPLWRTILYQVGAKLRAKGAPQSDIAEALDFNRYWMDVARTGEGYEEYLRRRDAIIRSGKREWLEYYSGEYSSLEQMRWSWSHILAFDSLPALARVRCPALGVFGELDVSTDAAEASATMREALSAAGNQDATTRVFPQATHSLMDASGAGMAPGVFDTLAGWLGARLR